MRKWALPVIAALDILLLVFCVCTTLSRVGLDFDGVYGRGAQSAMIAFSLIVVATKREAPTLFATNGFRVLAALGGLVSLGIALHWAIQP